MAGDDQPTRGRALGRREILQILGVGAVGWGISRLFRAATPLGADVGHSGVARDALIDDAAPRHVVEGADLTMAVFTDYLCPICRPTDAAMMAAVAADGRVRILYKDWPILGPASDRAARVALASQRQGLYERVHHGLMRDGGGLGETDLRRTVETAGGDWQRILSDLETQAAPIEQRLSRIRVEAFGLGLSGTPGLLIGTVLINSGMGEGDFSAAFARARSLASKA